MTRYYSSQLVFFFSPSNQFKEITGISTCNDVNYFICLLSILIYECKGKYIRRLHGNGYTYETEIYRRIQRINTGCNHKVTTLTFSCQL